MDINQAKTGKNGHESMKGSKAGAGKQFSRSIFELNLSKSTLKNNYLSRIVLGLSLLNWQLESFHF